MPSQRVQVETQAPDQEIEVRVVSVFRPEESRLSDLEEKHYVFSYHVEIENQGHRPLQLLSRHWWILDGNDRVREVEGDGVVGQQPLISPGETFTYSSYCVLPTPTGVMRGKYFLVAGDGERVEAVIPTFHLSAPHLLN
jgi:ApaG protein